MIIKRRKSKSVKIGNIYIGDSHPVAIQSMVKVKASSVKGAIKQIRLLEDAGCEIVRLALKDKQDAGAVKEIKKNVKVPLVADIHFDYRLALEAIDNGIDKIRLNPGNISKNDEIREVAKACKSAGIPIRVGVNSGSVERTTHLVDAMVKSALDYIKILEKFKFYDIVISLKASGILETVEAYRKIAKICDYPLHLGVTATGLPFSGAIKSGVALGSLLLEGIGDTIRVSLTDKPEEEIKAAKAILESLKLRSFGPEIISCPTCGRCEVNLTKIVKELETKLSANNHSLSKRPVKVAVMGCIVNGPGEARQADVGIAFGKNSGLVFRNGKAGKKAGARDCVGILLKEVERLNA
ncbi:MAG: flavodoxin-dependent (E)-4-hydroxy-3-methylbut-2-enyl-diphosphate synthase [Candidatus Omnitrophota bacterium]